MPPTETVTLIIAAIALLILVDLHRRVMILSSDMSTLRSWKYGDDQFDHSIDKNVSEALHWYLNEQNRIKERTANLPGMDLWSLAEDGWERNVLAAAETLRHLISEAYGAGTPDENFVAQSELTVRMTPDLANDLVQLANLASELGLKQIEWRIKKIEVVGECRKSKPNLDLIGSKEFELLELEGDILDRKFLRQEAKRAVWKSFCEARKH